jgi:hypothetical protein
MYIHKANISQATYNADTGQTEAIMPNSTMPGYQNLVNHYQTAQTMSIPNPGLPAHLAVIGPTEMWIAGYLNHITDANYTLQAGEHTAYSANWYQSVRISGVEIQEAQTANIENQVMGQSTNSVLSDIMSLLIQVITYLNVHVHTGVQAGSDVSGIVSVLAPDDTQVVSDKTYIDGNKNLAITGTYEPR